MRRLAVVAPHADREHRHWGDSLIHAGERANYVLFCPDTVLSDEVAGRIDHVLPDVLNHKDDL